MARTVLLPAAAAAALFLAALATSVTPAAAQSSTQEAMNLADDGRAAAEGIAGATDAANDLYGDLAEGLNARNAAGGGLFQQPNGGLFGGGIIGGGLFGGVGGGVANFIRGDPLFGGEPVIGEAVVDALDLARVTQAGPHMS
jgi:hypothetical protein